MYEFRLPRILTTLAVAGIVVGLSACDDDDPTVVVRLTDGEIVAVAMALNDAEIETSKLADTRAKDEDVKEFARMMIQDHSALNEDKIWVSILSRTDSVDGSPRPRTRSSIR